MNKKMLVIIISLSALVCIALVPVSFAIFTGSAFAQRTIGAYDAYGETFTSNYLRSGAARDNEIPAYTTDEVREASAYITVCNYPQGHQSRYSKTDIRFTLRAELVYYDEDEPTDEKYKKVNSSYMSSFAGHSVQIEDMTLGNGTLEATMPASGFITLQGKRASTSTFHVLFSTEFNTDPQPNLFVRLTATPEGEMLPTLSGIIKPAKKAQGASNNWTGTFRDDTENPVNDYDGFNYIVSGMGTGTFTLTWDSTRVGLSYVSQKTLLEIAGATKTGDSITFIVDSDVESRYEIQFYKVNTAGAEWSTEDGLVYMVIGEDKVVDFVFE